MRLAVADAIGDKAVGLIFDVKKFGGVEPDTAFILCALTTKRLREGFAVHSARVPKLFHSGFYIAPSVAAIGELQFGTIASGIDIGNVGL